MRVAVDRTRCCGAGMCALTQPHVFDQCAEDGTVVLLCAHPPQELWDSVEECVRLCPSQAISVDGNTE
ncbi:ferredoxin [Streptomyces monashensis]|uniref:Ferredoxin n=1 Tax=Streptomyces monashensis TaxID=1678012 RepID=A0A1S2QI65_9ACTN|nr:ferredoxin [Streptomyces monashensis]OIK05311.1 ferredoxin [Streptomyces monashensis]